MWNPTKKDMISYLIQIIEQPFYAIISAIKFDPSWCFYSSKKKQ